MSERVWTTEQDRAVGVHVLVARMAVESAEKRVTDAAYWAGRGVQEAERFASPEPGGLGSKDGVLKAAGPSLDTAVSQLAMAREHLKHAESLATALGFDPATVT